MKILIALATYNRRTVTTLCLENLKRCLDKDATLAIYDDCSTAYDEAFLRRYSAHVTRFRQNQGINRSRMYTFREFLSRYTDHELIYITDNDTIHDPAFLPLLRRLYAGQPADAKMPIGLYNSVFHDRPEFVIRETDSLFIRKTCPGVSQCYDRAMIAKIIAFLDANPGFENLPDFDYKWPIAVGLPFIQTKRSYLEHFARDRYEGGMHCGCSSDPAAARAEFDRDRAINPTPFLAGIRDRIIGQIMGEPLTAPATHPAH